MVNTSKKGDKPRDNKKCKKPNINTERIPYFKTVLGTRR